MLTSRMKSGCDSWWSNVSAASSSDGVHRVEMLDVELLLQRADAGVRTLQDGDVEAFLAAEVVVDHPLGGARLGGDLVHPATGVAAIGELAGGDLEDLRPGAVGVAVAFDPCDHGPNSRAAPDFPSPARQA